MAIIRMEEHHDESDTDTEEYQDESDTDIIGHKALSYQFYWKIFDIESGSPYSEIEPIPGYCSEYIADRVTVSVNAYKTDIPSSCFVTTMEMIYEGSYKDLPAPPECWENVIVKYHDKFTYKYLSNSCFEPQMVSENNSDIPRYIYKMKHEWSEEEFLDLLENKSLLANPSDGSIKLNYHIAFLEEHL